jgi:cyclopropane-fatty-acyl-phospholipid synthase
MRGDQGPEAAVVLRSRGAVWRLLLNPKLSLGEAYMDGSLVPLGSSIHDVLAVVLANLWIKPKSPLVSWLRRTAARVWRPVDQFNAAGRARRNVAHHYDLNGELYSLFLDRDRSTPAPISPREPRRSKKRRQPKRTTSPPSSASTDPACRCSTSAVAGAAWR